MNTTVRPHRAARAVTRGAVAALCGSFLVAACSLGTAGTGETAGTPVTEIAIDMTGSSRAWQPVMLQNLGVVLDVVARERGLVVVSPIDDNSAAHAAHVVEVSFGVDDGGNTIKRKRLTDAARRQVQDGVRHLLATTPLSKGSDQFGALAAAAHGLQQYPPQRRARVVLLSDMVNTAGGKDFRLTSGDLCDPARHRRLIAALRRDGLLPDLRGVQVWVGGGGLACGNTLTVRSEPCLRALWLDVFAAAGSPSTQFAPNLVDPGRST